MAGVPIESQSLAEWYNDEVITLSQAVSSKEILYHATGTSDPSDPDHFEYQFRGALKELTCCRGDFDGDGVHDFTPDYTAFAALHGATPDPHPAADLDFDGLWTSNDFTVFQSYQLEACPCDD